MPNNATADSLPNQILGESGASSNPSDGQERFDAAASIAQAARHEWPGLRAWRARGIDRRLRWSPLPHAEQGHTGSSSGSSSASSGSSTSIPGGSAAGAPVLVADGDAPSLGSLLLQPLPPGVAAPATADPPAAASATAAAAPASLVQAGVMVLRTACPRAKADLTHAAWSAYLSGRLPLRAPQEQPGMAAAAAAVVAAAAPLLQPTLASQEQLRGQEQEQEQEEGAEVDGRRHPLELVARGALGQQNGGPQGQPQQQQPQQQQQQQWEARQRVRQEVSQRLESQLPGHPARPERPQLVKPKEIPGHESSPLGLNGYMLHNLAHIELNAIDLAWDTVVRFSALELPDQFYEDFARVADDEARHLRWCLQRLGELGWAYGDMPAHDLLWQGCKLSAVDVAARLAVVPMSQEARGLDAGGRLVQRLRGYGDNRSAAVVAMIATEERAHVAVGVTWFARLCAALGVPAGPLFRRWLLHLNPDLLKGPFQHSERNLVGLPRDWYDPGAWPEEQEEEQEQQQEQQGQQQGGGRKEQREQFGAGSAGAAAAGAAREAGGAAAAARQQAGDGDGAGRRRGGGGGGGGGVAKPVRGAPAARLVGPLPRLSEAQLALLAERLGVFVGVEGRRAA
ncbi:hypothetical protein HYH02_007414 [Chlamydomonas schloesseri]|uniref:Uncharacterized protein n=1 Tax=Chlamydomonas schloesseri TaxID=2026947 RepID=A0A836B4N3_9CHLO|nr:hypothetical protein HYH02_007414 [Chlamydomonas schloesseri]|eukprot:KAG2447487.1 hypothetical protein HYH02_007414 [Chlamydomonas schloesseri]